MGAIKERLHEPRTQPGTIILDADAVLYSLDNDCTLNQLDDAHRALDARARAVPPRTEVELCEYVMVIDHDATEQVTKHSAATHHQPKPATLNHRTEPVSVAALRRAVDAQHRMEVHDYAQRLKVAIRYQLCIRGLKFDVNVATFDVQGFIKFTPLAPPARPLTLVDQAIADAITLTPTPGALPGTLLERAEAEYAAQSQRRSRSTHYND